MSKNNAVLPSVSVELGGQEFTLVASFYALKKLEQTTGGKDFKEFLQSDPFDALPDLLLGFMVHLEDPPSQEFIQRNVGPANMDYLGRKIGEVMGAGENPTGAKAVEKPRTGGRSKPSQKSS